jgi:basic amino acid/polyamine antiporter, APA family
MMRGLFRTKPIESLLGNGQQAGPTLRRALGPLQLTLLGVGATVGAGIFATIGTAVAGDTQRPGAGPSIILSFVITALVCALTALCYAEMASMVPASGSAYTYTYATLGELPAWIIGWDLILEYAIGNVAVAISWANYFRTLLAEVGIIIPRWVAVDYRTATQMPGFLATVPHILGLPVVLNVPALLIVLVLTGVLVRGIRESAALNAAMVLLKIAVLLFFVAFCLMVVDRATLLRNVLLFQPNGWAGTLAGAAVVFFAYIGFDAVSTVAEETRQPSRDLPIAIFASLAISTVLYIVVATAFVGVLPYSELTRKLSTEQAEPLTIALAYAAPRASWARALVALGSVIAHTAVLLVFQLGQTRIFFAIARDGLLPPSFAHVHPRFRTPHVPTILTGLLVGGCAALASIDEMVDLTNIGTLFAFCLVCVGVSILRHTQPERARPFRLPGGAWLVPLLGVLSCLGLMVYLPPLSWWRFAAWLTIGLVLYALYGYHRSMLRRRVRA